MHKLLAALKRLFLRLEAPDASTDDPLPPIPFTKPKRAVHSVFLHCSASDHPHHDNVQTLKKWHVVERGWSDIGYHFLISFDGSLHICRPLNRTPAAQRGYNKGSIAICLSGGGKMARPTLSRLSSTIRFCGSAQLSIRLTAAGSAFTAITRSLTRPALFTTTAIY